MPTLEHDYPGAAAYASASGGARAQTSTRERLHERGGFLRSHEPAELAHLVRIPEGLDADRLTHSADAHGSEPARFDQIRDGITASRSSLA